MMLRVCSLCGLVLAFPFFIQADEPATPTETVIRLQVQPMPAPRPALRYQLLPELHTMNPGNPVQGFMMCFTGLAEIYNKNAMQKWGYDNWDEIPLKDLPLEKMRGYGNTVIRLANYAARLDTPNWQVLPKMKTEDINQVIVPEIQKIRELVQVLLWRLRMETAERRYDDALVTAQTMFALARTLAECPSLNADLVGVAITHITIERVQEMISQPGCPNLFWALTDLPQPFIDPRKALQGDRMWLRNFFHKLNDKQPMTDSQMQDVLNNFKSNSVKDKTQSLIRDLARDKKHVQAARQRLLDAGLTEAVVQQFPDLQVTLLDGKLIWEKKQDDAISLMTLPFWQVEPLFTKSVQPGDHLFTRNVLVFYKIRQANARTEQRFALLRCIEALRIHAADHDGKLPERLNDIKLPLPVDPITGRAFQYKLEAGIAHLRGTPPPGMEKSPHNIRYEISIRK